MMVSKLIVDSDHVQSVVIGVTSAAVISVVTTPKRSGVGSMVQAGPAELMVGGL